MGYSICTVAKSKKAKADMLAFMDTFFRPFHVVSDMPGDYSYASNPTDNMSYCHGKLKIGIDYGCLSGPERKYAYSLVYWMALRIGRKKVIKGIDTFSFNYDDCPQESWCLALDNMELPPDFPECAQVNEHGWRWNESDQREFDCWNGGVVDGKKLPDPDPQYPNPNSQEEYDRIEKELERLSDLWNRWEQYKEINKACDGITAWCQSQIEAQQQVQAT